MQKKKWVSIVALLTLLTSCEPAEVEPNTPNSNNSSFTTSSDSSKGDEISNPSTSTEVNKKYRVTFVNYDGSKLLSTFSNDKGVVSYTGSEPTRTDKNKNYKFDGWTIDQGDGAIYSSDNLPIIKTDTIFVATFSEVKNKYIVRFERDDGSLIESIEFEQGQIAKPSNLRPTKESDDEYDYSFSSWDKNFSKVTSNTTYVANFNKTKKQYTITFLNGDGSTLFETKYDYGTFNIASKDEVSLLTPTKKETSGKKYTFNNQWKNRDTNEILDDNTILRKNCTYIPQFGETIITYTIKFVYEDGTPIRNIGNNGSLTYGYGDTISGINNPTKQNTAEYEYTFVSWDRNFETVTTDTTYTAKFKQNKRKYSITYYNGDGSFLYAEEIEYGSKTSYKGSKTPTKVSTDTQEFVFTGKWQNRTTGQILTDDDVVYSATEYIAMFNDQTRYYTVKFVDDNDSVLDTKTYTYNSKPTYSKTTPTKASTAEYNYIFNGWDKELSSVTSDVTYKATYKKEKRKYTITYKRDDGTLLKSDEIEYGSSISYGSNPTKAKDAQYTYTFSNWSPAFTTVTGNQTYTAIFDKKVNKYTVKFVNYDNTVLSNKIYDYGETPTAPANPTRPSTSSNTYTFVGWDKTISKVTGDITYKAQYTSTTNTYTIKFVNYDGTVLSEVIKDANSKVEYTGVTPTRSQDAQYNYTFNGWDKEITNATANVTYTATYKTTIRSYTVTFLNENGSSFYSTTLEYGKTPTRPATNPTKASTAQYSYTFSSWSPSLSMVTGNQTYTPNFTENLRSYTVTFKYEDGTTLDANQTVKYGNYVTMNKTLINPTKAEDDQYTYTFSKWNKDPSSTKITGDSEFIAIFTKTAKFAYIIFQYDSGEIIDKKSYPIGATITNAPTPTKENSVDGHYSYKFIGWNKPFETVKAGGAIYTAKFETIINSFTVKFVDNYGKQISANQKVEWGKTVTMNSSLNNPTKASTAEWKYTFTNWNIDPTTTLIKSDVTFIANFMEAKQRYKITFNNYDGSYLYDAYFEYGETPTYTNSVIPEKPCSDPLYKYDFIGWTPNFTAVTNNATYTAKFSDKIKRTANITFILGDKTIVRENVEYGTIISTLIPYFNKEKIDEEPDEFYWTFDGIFKDGDKNNEDLCKDAATIVNSNATYKAIWTCHYKEYRVIFTSDQNSEEPLEGCEEYEQYIYLNDFIKKPTIDPYKTDSHGVATGDITYWQIVYSVAGSSKKKTFILSNFYKTVKELKPYWDNESTYCNIQIVPLWPSRDTNVYENSTNGISLGKYPQSLANDSINDIFRKYFLGYTGQPYSSISYNSTSGYYEYDGKEYAKLTYTGSTESIQLPDSDNREIEFEKNKIYMFNVEPIKWMRRKDSKLTGGKTMLVSTKILDYTTYFDSKRIRIKDTGKEKWEYSEMIIDQYSSIDGFFTSYKDSNLRNFLINDFYNKAFRNDLQAKKQIIVKQGGIDNSLYSMGLSSGESHLGDLSNTEDKIFALSKREADTLMVDTKSIKNSDYAQVQATMYGLQFSYYLRSPAANEAGSTMVYCSGLNNDNYDVEAIYWQGYDFHTGDDGYLEFDDVNKSGVLPAFYCYTDFWNNRW